ncbi:MAG: UDP-N-acetylglucosamine--N-acetylmuramyl-(pentapeptide) pyrophosphoryl-undecaprenol N-acetylglucosamine transferase [Bacteriovoracaceae bacterium]|nr:UDP-N-acetylglucosamine--N-acetylmuramyl-(pentapeptide) pyrophosphoryl-undecaprenol N-acetylglucosamine transferase [Bacteriovoracaceae bacterium]
MKKVYIVAGGTGGHINAALSLGDSFSKEFEVIYYSGTRPLDYKLFKGQNVVHLNGAGMLGKSALYILKSISLNTILLFKLLLIFLFKRPSFIVGTGGYICGPTLLSAWMLGIKVYILEQNAVAGFTNRILSKIASKVFVNFKETIGLTGKKVIVTGNPIRSEIQFYENTINGKINILIFGGSLGAKQFDPLVRSLIDENKYSIKHQVGNTNKDILEGNDYERFTYIDNMSEAYKWANIIICRSGASTVSELEVVKKPALIIPFKFATHDHQTLNAKSYKDKKLAYTYIFNKDVTQEELIDKAKEVIFDIIENRKFESNKEYTSIDSVNLIKKEILGDS